MLLLPACPGSCGSQVTIFIIALNWFFFFFLPLGTQLAAWNQEPIPWGGGVACTRKCRNYCDSLQGMFFFKA